MCRVPGVNQQEREALTEAILADVQRRYGPGVDLREYLAVTECDGCGFTVRRVHDPQGPLPNWERDSYGRLLCPNCQ